jgi:hypothetical protein
MMKPLRWIKLFSINNNVASAVEARIRTERRDHGEHMHMVGDKDGMDDA